MTGKPPGAKQYYLLVKDILALRRHLAGLDVARAVGGHRPDQHEVDAAGVAVANPWVSDRLRLGEGQRCHFKRGGSYSAIWIFPAGFALTTNVPDSHSDKATEAAVSGILSYYNVNLCNF